MNSVLQKMTAVLGVLLGSVAPSAAREWALVTSRNDATGQYVIFRFIKQFVTGFVQAEQPVRISLEWEYQGSNGQPDSSVAEAMNRFEDAIDPLLAEDGVATLALVSTGDNLREWTYYAKSEVEFMRRLKRALLKQPAYPVNIRVAYDARWTRYNEFIARQST